MRFLHAADIHLDSPLTGLSAYPDAPAALLRTATRDALVRLVDLVLDEQLDFVVLAGDLYDGPWKDFNTGIFFARQMGRLKAAGVPVFVLFGNHDADSDMTKKLDLPDNVQCFSSLRPSSFRLPALKVVLHGRSFRDKATTDNLVLGYPDAEPGWFNIGVLHTALEGHSVHANYAPCSLAQLDARGYQYWALGHVHERKIWTLPGCTVAFPGNLQGRHIRESGPRGALRVTVEGDAPPRVEPVMLDVLRWQLLAVDVSSAHSLAEAVQQVGQQLEALLAAADHSLPLALRVQLHGHSPAHGQLFGLEGQLRAEILARASALNPERLWIEKVKVDTQPALHSPWPDDALHTGADALADLHALLSRADSDEVFLASLRDDLNQLIGKLPLEVLAAVPRLEALRQGELAPLVREVAPSLLAHLAGEG